mmetsp:Transcript_55305/g.142419  ORF Transcript_55305/g.142419 Transcript_55305/m.142419 type:complete len:244 (+) Transcript_55305:1-732(+)
MQPSMRCRATFRQATHWSSPAPSGSPWSSYCGFRTPPRSSASGSCSSISRAALAWSGVRPSKDQRSSTPRVLCASRTRSSGIGSCTGTGNGAQAGFNDVCTLWSTSSNARGPTCGYRAASVKEYVTSCRRSRSSWDVVSGPSGDSSAPAARPSKTAANCLPQSSEPSASTSRTKRAYSTRRRFLWARSSGQCRRTLLPPPLFCTVSLSRSTRTGAGGATKTFTGAEGAHHGDQQTPSEMRTDT